MEKTRLGGDHPDYQTLLSALTQILDGILLNAWRTESGYFNLADFAATEPSAEALLALADNIIRRHATPMVRVDGLDNSPPVDEDESDKSDCEPAAAGAPPVTIGHIEDFLPQLAMMFRGASGNNYCTEILHFLLNLKHVLTPEFV